MKKKRTMRRKLSKNTKKRTLKKRTLKKEDIAKSQEKGNIAKLYKIYSSDSTSNIAFF
jgi:flagellar motility protein MotE (MotC chaperone)